ncbi:hypothetical protein AB0G15_21650 [Streptosporangium sp. NPDC023825]|uniref:hypothetical protein n=1 Tax=Streptosporangium sp. NPDC023825 TaxID=3154909 RepID=UPI00343B74A5
MSLTLAAEFDIDRKNILNWSRGKTRVYAGDPTGEVMSDPDADTVNLPQTLF